MQSVPDNSNLQGKKEKGSSYRKFDFSRENYKENDLKGNENYFDLAGGSC